MPNTLNHLNNESSLYLQQHATNPVDWYPWGTDAINKAKKEKKPILLSIGYSACHWCHVMANESFIDPETAKIMNDHFVNIKVDREERPDLDKIYQTTHQLLTGHGGGWPLTVFLNPNNLTPFFSGTYFPFRSGLGMPSFKGVLHKVSEYFHANPKQIDEQNQKLQQALQQLVTPKIQHEEELSAKPLLQARQQLAAEFDPLNGGFGSAPKFPQPTKVANLLNWWLHSKSQGREDKPAFAMVQMTLEHMANGGIYDQLGGGFYRYSVDAHWQIPHFEKMLYDNGQLLSLYAQVIPELSNFANIITETITWATREMRSPEGAFYAALSADSEHHEGKFYAWDKEQIQSLLTIEEFAVVRVIYDLDNTPNFESLWHLHIDQNPAAVAKKLNMNLDELLPLLNTARHKLFTARTQRIRPDCDKKIITSWNALMIKGLAAAGQRLNNKDYIILAQKNLDFIHQHLWIEKRLYSTYQNGAARVMGYLDDYAFLLDATLTLLSVAWRKEDLDFAIELADGLLTHFEDKNYGGFFFTAHDHEQLIQRPKPLMDEAIPAGNGIAAQALIQIGYLLGKDHYLKAAEKTLHMSWSAITAYPAAHCSLLTALHAYIYPPQIIVLRGSNKDLLQWQPQNQLALGRYIVAIPDTESNLPNALSDKVPQKNKVVAYICSGHQCLSPIDNLSEFQDFISNNH